MHIFTNWQIPFPESTVYYKETRPKESFGIKIIIYKLYYVCLICCYVQWKLEDPGSVCAEPFELKPAMFKLDAGQVTTLEVT